MLLAAAVISNRPVAAEQLFQLKNGLILKGSKAEIASLKEGFGAAAAGQVNVRPDLVDRRRVKTCLHPRKRHVGSCSGRHQRS